MAVRLLLALLFVGSALLVAWVMLRQLRLVYRLRQAGAEALGTVVRQRRVRTRNGARNVPTIRFVTPLGQRVEQEHSLLTLRELDFFDGDEVLLRYDPSQPARFLLVQELADAGPYVFATVGVLMVAGALLALKEALAAAVAP